MTALHRLRQLHQQATQAPWKVGAPNFRCTKHDPPHPGPPDCQYEQVGWTDYVHSVYVDRAYAHRDTEEGLVVGMWDYEEGGVFERKNAELIAAARNALPHLLDIAEAADAVMLERRHTAKWHDRLDELRESLDRLNSA